jgi:hypothetical protein
VPIVLAVLIVVALFLLLRKLRGAPAVSRSTRGGPTRRNYPVAPDDDPEFLRELGRRLRRRQQGEDS